MSQTSVEEGCNSFLRTVDAVYGVYLDAVRGFGINHQQMAEHQARTGRADSTPFAYDADDAPSNKGLDDPMLHKTTIGEFKTRNEEGGQNWVFLANVCLVGVYQYWEDHYRKEIATALGLPKKNDLCVQVMGDLRHYRRSIIHRNGIAVPEVERCEVLTWFRPGERIELTSDQMQTIVDELRRVFSYIAEEGALP